MSVILEKDTNNFKDYFQKALERHMLAYLDGNIRRHMVKFHDQQIAKEKDDKEKEKAKDLAKVFKENNIFDIFKKKLTEDGAVAGAPANAMGASSSTEGPIETFDPLLGKKKLKRKVPNKESIK